MQACLWSRSGDIIRSVTKQPSDRNVLPADVQVIAHLEVILASPAFRPSPKCRDFLRFVVLEGIAGRGDALKERTIATEVFGRGINFEPGEDSVVRVRAREVRKRLNDFYTASPDHSIRIDLPVGGYIPLILTQESSPKIIAEQLCPVDPTLLQLAETAKAQGSSSWSRRRLLAAGTTAAVAAALYPLARRVRHDELDQLWEPIFATGRPLIISIPILTTDAGQMTDRVGLGASAAASEVIGFLARRNYDHELRLGAELTYSQICEHPTLLLSGFSAAWRTRLNKQFRFALVQQEDQHQAIAVRDLATGHVWGPVVRTNGYFGDEDYGVVTRFFNDGVGQTVFVASGVTTFGTEAAARYLVEPALFSTLLKNAPADWQKKNFQAVIHISVVGTTIANPSVVSTYFWST